MSLRNSFEKFAALAVILGTLGGCTAYGDGFAYSGPIEIASDGDGADGYCAQYADRTAANAYENYSDNDDGSSFITYRQAERAGERAYANCVRRQAH